MKDRLKKRVYVFKQVETQKIASLLIEDKIFKRNYAFFMLKARKSR